jgi:acyl-CoA synthetase (AMP-forming)/AMP-acid ligase II
MKHGMTYRSAAMTLADIIARNARLSPDGLAVKDETRSVTHSALARRVSMLAGALRACAGKGARVAILAFNCVEFLEIQAACEWAGTIGVGINVRLAEVEIGAVLADCQAEALFFEAEFSQVVERLRTSFGDLRLICIGDSPAWAEQYEALMSSAETLNEPDAFAGDIVHLVYTSGTTGQPKGAILTHGALFEAARMTAHEGGVWRNDVALLVMPMFHIGAKIEQLAFSLSGAAVIFHRKFDPEAVLRALSRERVTALHMAPVLIQRLLDAPGFEAADKSSLRSIHYSASPMPVPLLRRALAAFGSVFTQIYGLTECSVCTVLKPHQHVTDGTEQTGRLASAGQEFLGTEVRIVTPDGADCAQGEIGEVLVRSPGQAQGYWGAADINAQSFVGDWLRTGDMGYFDRERFLFLVDRAKDVIVTGGENVFSREVEDALRSHADVGEVAVIGVPDSEWGETVMAIVIPAPGSAPDADALTSHCRDRIAGYKRPRQFKFVDELPRLASGKIDKKNLRAPFWAGQSRFIN